MDAFRRGIVLLGALPVCALAAACSSSGGPEAFSAYEVPAGSAASAEQPVPTSVTADSTVPTPVSGATGSSAPLVEEQSPLVVVDSGDPAVPDGATGTVSEVALLAELADLDPVDAPRLFGPADGAIFHDPSNTSLMRKLVGANESDVVVSASFTNPFDPARRPYDHGFIIRLDQGRFHAIVLAGDGTWQHYVSSGASTTLRDSGDAETALVERGESNSLALVASGPSGWLFVNGHLAARLDLSGVNGPGDAGVVANVGAVTNVLGAQTGYTSLTVGGLVRLDAPEQGTLAHGRTSRAEGEPVAPAAGLLAEVDFDVPYGASKGDWSFGFLLEADDGSTHQVTFNDRALWRLSSTPSDPDGEVESTFGPTTTASFDAGSSNRLTIVRTFGEWRVYLNDGLLATFETGEGAELVSLRLVGGVELFEQPAGSESVYSRFIAWALGN